MWTKIFHPTGLSKGHMERGTQVSSGRHSCLPDVVWGVLQCLSTEVGAVLGDCRRSKDLAGINFNRANGK